MAHQIEIVEKSTGEVLNRFELEAEEKAFAQATYYEEMGMDVEIKRPSIAESLARSLGADQEDTETLRRELEEEILSHDSSCICSPDEESKFSDDS